MVKLNLKAIQERITPLGGRESYDREIIFETSTTSASTSLTP